MNIAIIGAGFTGLSAGRRLAGAGHRVTIIERESLPGGLAAGFTSPGWDWPLEKHYHHIFASDSAFLSLAKEINYPVTFHRPVTSTFYSGNIEQLDSPVSLLQFSSLSFIDRLRTGFGLAALKINPYWPALEGQTAKKYITSVMGQSSWRVIWEPLFVGKFGSYADKISAAWFWARIVARTPSLGYPEGGFGKFAMALDKSLTNIGVRIIYNRTVDQITPQSQGFSLKLDSGQNLKFDRVLCTLSSGVFAKITPDLPKEYAGELNSLASLGAVTLVLALKKAFLPGTYWLNINDRSMPYLAVVEHTNFADISHYGGDHLLYIGNYLPDGHKYFSLSDKDLIKLFSPHLQKINSDFTPSWINHSWIWKTSFAQPIVLTDYSRRIPSISTPIPGLYLANMQQIYPWDRGVNYAVKLGKKQLI